MRPSKQATGLRCERAIASLPMDACSKGARVWILRPSPASPFPWRMAVGLEVYGGTINLDGVLLIEVTRTGGESTLGKVIALMQSAERSKPPITRWLERYATQYLVLVLLIAAMTWFLTNDAQAMLAVLVAACPCALALAAPATAIAGIAVAARHGILIRGSAFLEELADTSALVVDKTGTLTSGMLRLQDIKLYNKSDSLHARRLAGSLGAASSHPVSRALAGVVETADRIPLENIRERPGLGVVADTSAGQVVLGRPELFEQLAIKMPAIPVHDGPIAGLSSDGTFMGWLLLADTPRREAAAAMADLRDLGLSRQILLTGDRASVAETLAHELGIPEFQAQALPEDKLKRVMKESKNGFRPLVVGDGVNDSLALKAGASGSPLPRRSTSQPSQPISC